MSSQSHGKEKLTGAEKKAADKIVQTKMRTAHYVEEAKDQALAEIAKYKNERDRAATEFDAQKSVTDHTDKLAARQKWWRKLSTH